MVWTREDARPGIRRKKVSGDGTIWEKKKMKSESEMDGLCLPRAIGQQKMKSMTELAGGELCLP